MKLKLEDAFIDLRPGLRLVIASATLEIDGVEQAWQDAGGEHGIAPAKAVAKATQPAARKAAKKTKGRPKKNLPFTGGIENDILAKLSQLNPPGRFIPLGSIFRMIRPDAPLRENGGPSYEYGVVRTVVRKLRDDGILDADETSGRFMYRLSPTLHDAAKGAQAD